MDGACAGEPEEPDPDPRDDARGLTRIGETRSEPAEELDALLEDAGGIVEKFIGTGDCLNVAARLQSIAPPMGVIVGERTRSAAASFEVERLEAVRVKGKSDQVAVWRVAGRVSGPVEAARRRSLHRTR